MYSFNFNSVYSVYSDSTFIYKYKKIAKRKKKKQNKKKHSPTRTRALICLSRLNKTIYSITI